MLLVDLIAASLCVLFAKEPQRPLIMWYLTKTTPSSTLHHLHLPLLLLYHIIAIHIQKTSLQFQASRIHTVHTVTIHHHLQLQWPFQSTYHVPFQFILFANATTVVGGNTHLHLDTVQ